MSPLESLAVAATFSLVLGIWGAFQLGRMSRKKEEEKPEATLSRLDDGRIRVELGRPVLDRWPQGQSPGWKKMPPRDGRGRFLKKPVT